MKLKLSSKAKTISDLGRVIKTAKVLPMIRFNAKEYILKKLRLKGKIYQQAKVILEWDKVILNNNEYNVVKITLKKRDGEAIHRKPMLLISNIKIKSYIQAKEIYHIYLLRTKIESVFKFLKDVLGWEEFQVRDWDSIKNIIALCFFIGNYFYEIESSLVDNPTIEIICQMGNGKDKVTRYFFLEGLKVLLIAQKAFRLKKELEISDETWQEMQTFAGIGEIE